MLAATRHETATEPPRKAPGATMHAIVQPEYGSPDVLRFDEVATPALGDDDVLVRVHAASVCRGDLVLLSGQPYLARLAFGLRRPKHRVAGQNVAGTVEAVGGRVRTVKPGDEVYGYVLGGAFAEYVRMRADAVAPKPRRLTFEEAAALPVSGTTALLGLRDVGRLQPGQTVLINGASGGVGAFAVQLAKAMGAEVTAVCSTRNVGQMRSLGADDVVDYTREDFVRRDRRYDVMLDLVGNRSLDDCRAVLQPKGSFVSCSGGQGNWLGPILWMLKLVLVGLVASQRLASYVAIARRDHLLALNAFVEAGKLTPVIDRRYALSDAAAALRHVAEGHAQGTTVITP